MFDLAHNIGRGATAATISATVEAAIAEGRLAPAAQLPPVRDLAADLGVSAATVAAAYRTLKQRGLVTANGRRGTSVATQPPLRVRSARALPLDARDLASGNPDPSLLPALGPALARIDPTHKLYGGPNKLAQLVALARVDFDADHIGGEIAIVGGALDGIERVLQTHLRPGDRVAVEDPSWPRINDLLYALGFTPEPVAIDQHGLVPDALERALHGGARALIATPRGQNPTGATLSRDRARRLRDVLSLHANVLVIEDDYVSSVAGAPYFPLRTASVSWAVVRSLSKILAPDLRVALVAGDSLTISRVEGRQLLGPGWVSHLLQQTAAGLWASAATKKLLARAERTYAERRAALIDALAEYGIAASGSSGLGVWVPLTEEAAVVQLLLERGWAVSPGERYRFQAPPGIRITTTTLKPNEARQLAAALHESLHSTAATYAG
jgi:DNA-binding transcriptional MocR family regulator